MADLPLFGAKWLEEAGIQGRRPRFVNGLPMLCLPVASEEECCHWIDLLTWNSRTRHTPNTSYTVWQGKLLPEYAEPYAGQLVYYGQHPDRVNCRGVYYVHNLATGSFDCFKRDLSDGHTINQNWTAPAGILSSIWAIGLTPDMSFGAPLGGRMTFIDFDDRVVVIGSEPDTVEFVVDPGTGVSTVNVIPGPTFLQVRDFHTGAILREGYLNWADNGHVSHANCNSFFAPGMTTPVLHCGPGEGIASAVATEDGEVWITHYAGLKTDPGPKPPGEFWYLWAHPAGKGKLEYSPGLRWVETEFIREDAPGGNAFVRPGPLQHVVNSDDAPDCLPEPEHHSEPSHSACLYFGANRGTREYVGRIHAGAAKLSDNIISGRKYGVGSEDGRLLIVRDIPAGEVLKAGGAPSLFAYVIQDGQAGGDSQAEIDECPGEFDPDPNNPDCHNYFGDALLSIVSADLCACSLELLLENCTGPCKPFKGFWWALCATAECVFPEFGTKGPESFLPCHPAPTIAQGSGICGETFWVPMKTFPTSLVISGYDGCGCKFWICKTIPAQTPCECPVEFLEGSNTPCWFEKASDLLTQCFTHDVPICPPYDPEVTACAGFPQLFMLPFELLCPDGHATFSWSWYTEGSASAEWCDDAMGSPYICYDRKNELRPHDIVTIMRCGYWYGDLACTGAFYEVGWDITVNWHKPDGGTCSKSFRIMLATGGTP
jgi:hypothetical protein